ncbi:MAG: hypothetical protein R2771_15265 [Saprospiraceae bacterium]
MEQWTELVLPLKILQNILKLQSGKLQDYAFAMVTGAVLLAIIFIYIWNNDQL